MVNIYIYDTLYSALDDETHTIVKQLFGLKATTRINIVPIQLQKGCKDCGVFTIAIMTSLTCGENLITKA